MRRVAGFFDWKFIVATAVLVAVAYMVWAAREAATQRDKAIEVAESTKVAYAEFRAETRKDWEYRDKRLNALLDYLEDAGTVVPPAVLLGTRPVRAQPEDDDDGGGRRARGPAATEGPPPDSTPNTGGGGVSDPGGSKSADTRSERPNSADTRRPDSAKNPTAHGNRR